MTPTNTTVKTSGTFARLFQDHPASVGESYGVHFLFALRFSGQLFGASLAALVHAFVPALCQKTASARVMALHETLSQRGK